MNKRQPLQSIDISKIVKAKTVFVNIYSGIQSAAPINYKFFFDGDDEIDSSLIVGIESHKGFEDGSIIGDFASWQDFDPLGGQYAYEYIKSDINSFALTLSNVHEKPIWDKCPLYCLHKDNTGKYFKRLNNRIRLKTSFIQAFAPYNVPGGCDGNRIKYLAPITFYFIPYK